MRLACFALTWSCALALAGEGDAAAAQRRVAPNAKTVRCISRSPSLQPELAKQKVAKTRASTTFERHARLQVDYDSPMSETGRKLDDNRTSQRKHGAKRPWIAAGVGASEIRTTLLRALVLALAGQNVGAVRSVRNP